MLAKRFGLMDKIFPLTIQPLKRLYVERKATMGETLACLLQVFANAVSCVTKTI